MSMKQAYALWYNDENWQPEAEMGGFELCVFECSELDLCPLYNSEEEYVKVWFTLDSGAAVNSPLNEGGVTLIA